ncbi:MAG: class I SAM-dependent methyltransferase, partial [Spiribacter salinus]
AEVDRVQHWSTYWRSQDAHSRGTAPYGEVLESLWQQLFERTGRDASVLDVGTGNGDVAILMARYSVAGGLDWDITGVDFAEIHPPERVSPALREQMTFLSGTRVEDLPFDDGTFDLVTSQFAVEYAHLDSALSECLRVLKPEAQLGLLAHCEDSGLVRGSRGTIDVLDRALDNGGVFDCAAQLIQRVQPLLSGMGVEALKKDPLANRLRVAFNEAIDQLQKSVTSRALVPLVDQMLADTTSVVQSCNQLSMADVEEQLAQVRSKYVDSRQRALDQLEAASTGEKIPEALEALGIAEDRIHSEDVYFNTDRIGRYFLVTG